MATKNKELLSANDYDTWLKEKKCNYKKNVVIQDCDYTVDFNLKSYDNLVGNERVSYDEYLDIQRITKHKELRSYFQTCYYNLGFGEFCGKIEKIRDNRLCLKFINVSGMYSNDGSFFEGKEDHVWMENKDFKNYSEGDCIKFTAEVYQYIKTGDGKKINYGLRNPENITIIKEPGLNGDGIYIMNT